jgi:hypothetical protein
VLEIITAKPISLARSCKDMPILDHQFLNKYQKHNIAITITITSKNILQTKRGNALIIMSYIVLLLTVYYELITTVSFSSSNIFNYIIACIFCGFFYYLKVTFFLILISFCVFFLIFRKTIQKKKKCINKILRFWLEICFFFFTNHYFKGSKFYLIFILIVLCFIK